MLTIRKEKYAARQGDLLQALSKEVFHHQTGDDFLH
jgi:hypothetical protein